MNENYVNDDVKIRITAESLHSISEIVLYDGTSIIPDNETKKYICEVIINKNGEYSFTVIDGQGLMTTKVFEVYHIDKTPPIILSDKKTVISDRQVLYEIKTSDSGSGVKKITAKGFETIENGTGAKNFTAFFSFERNDIYEIIVEDWAGNLTSKKITVSEIKRQTPYSKEELLKAIHLVAITPDKVRAKINPYASWKHQDYYSSKYTSYLLDDLNSINVNHYCGNPEEGSQTTNDLRFFMNKPSTGKDIKYEMGDGTQFDWGDIVIESINYVPSFLDFYMFFKKPDGSFMPLGDVNEVIFEIADGQIEEKDSYINGCHLFRPSIISNNNGDGVLVIKDSVTNLEIKKLNIYNNNETDYSGLVPPKPKINYVLKDNDMSATVTISGVMNDDSIVYCIPSVSKDWVEYNSPFEVTGGPTVVLAKQSNSYGTGPEARETIEIKTLMDLLPKLPVITTTDNSDGSKLASISFPGDVVNKLVDLGDGSLVPYTAPFTIKTTTTVRAVGENSFGRGPMLTKKIEIFIEVSSVNDIDFSKVYIYMGNIDDPLNNIVHTLPKYITDAGYDVSFFKNKVFKLPPVFTFNYAKEKCSNIGMTGAYLSTGEIPADGSFTVEDWPFDYYEMPRSYPYGYGEANELFGFCLLNKDKNVILTDRRVADLEYNFRATSSIFKVEELYLNNFHSLTDETIWSTQKYCPLRLNTIETPGGAGSTRRKYRHNGVEILDMTINITDNGEIMGDPDVITESSSMPTPSLNTAYVFYNPASPYTIIMREEGAITDVPYEPMFLNSYNELALFFNPERKKTPGAVIQIKSEHTGGVWKDLSEVANTTIRLGSSHGSFAGTYDALKVTKKFSFEFRERLNNKVSKSVAHEIENVVDARTDIDYTKLYVVPGIYGNPNFGVQSGSDTSVYEINNSLSINVPKECANFGLFYYIFLGGNRVEYNFQKNKPIIKSAQSSLYYSEPVDLYKEVCFALGYLTKDKKLFISASEHTTGITYPTGSPYASGQLSNVNNLRETAHDSTYAIGRSSIQTANASPGSGTITVKTGSTTVATVNINIT